MLEQLATLQVSANLLHRKDQLVKCSDVRNHFTWRAPELQHLSDEKVRLAGWGGRGGQRAVSGGAGRPASRQACTKALLCA